MRTDATWFAENQIHDNISRARRLFERDPLTDPLTIPALV